MSPEAIVSALTKLRRDLRARQHPDGYDFAVTHRSAGIVETMNVLGVRRSETRNASKLVTAASNFHASKPNFEMSFAGDLQQLLNIVDGEVAVAKLYLRSEFEIC